MANKPQENLKFYKGYGANFKALRTNAGLTQIQLADIIYISDKTISQIESEQREPTIGQTKLYHEHFKVSFEYLTGETSVPNITEQYVSEYTGLSGEALKALTTHCGNDLKRDVPVSVLNKLLLSDYFYTLLHTFGNIEISSGMLEAIDDYPTYKDVWNECDVNRYRAFKTLEKISDLFDRRESNEHQGEPK